jgi:hypothetical protein
VTASEPVTVAEETVTAAMLGGFLAATVLGYATLRAIGEWTVVDALIMVLGVFVVGGYIAPHLAAWWLGKSLHEIMG